eukprot:m.36469 g.36469  ORF g.36469 m.36469 type:complete len:58 (-) comp10006_c0_seq1:6-179(-)
MRREYVLRECNMAKNQNISLTTVPFFFTLFSRCFVVGGAGAGDGGGEIVLTNLANHR